MTLMGIETIFSDQLLYRRTLLLGNPRYDKVLVSGQTEFTSEHSRNREKPTPPATLARIAHTSPRNVKCIVSRAILILRPSVAITVLGKLIGPRFFQFIPETLFNKIEETIYTVIVDRIFQPGVLSFASIPMVPLYEDNFFRNVDNLVSGHKANHICYPRVGLLLTVGHAHASSHRNIEAFKSIPARNGYESEIVGIYINVIIGRNRNCDLEFPRQVVLPVNRLFLTHTRLHLFTIKPYFMIGTGSRGKVIAKVLRYLKNLSMKRRDIRIRVAHDIAVHVTTCRNGIEGDIVDFPDRPFQVTLDNAMKLISLPSGELDCVVGILCSQSVDFDPLLRGRHPSGNTDPDHK